MRGLNDVNQHVLDPRLTFPKEEEWRNEAAQDACLLQLLDYWDFMDQHQLGPVVWSDELYESFFSQSLIAQDKTKQLSSLLYYRFWNGNNVEIVSNDVTASCQCEPSEIYDNNSGAELFLQMLHNLAIKKNTVMICAPKPPKTNMKNAVFKCICHGQQHDVTMIFSKYKLLVGHKISDIIWPISAKQSSVLEKALELALGRDYEDEKIYTHKLDEKFVKELAEYGGDREPILLKLARRVTLTRYEAYKNKALHDEPLLGGKDERRFRVSKSIRIHYREQKDGSILFLHFYPEGKHEEGLR